MDNSNDKRLTTFPLKDKESWFYYKQHLSAFWVVEEIDFSSDRKDFESLTDSEQKLIEMILAFFAVSDNMVSENLEVNFINHPLNSLETDYFYAFQMAMENIHAETYSAQIENIIRDPERKRELFNAIETFPSIKEKTKWIKKWMADTTVSYAKRLLAFVLVEGIYFSSSFSTIFFFKRKGLMPGLTFSNELISKDEGLHCTFGIFLMKRHNLMNPLSDEEVHSVVKEAVTIEKMFAKECFSVGNIKGLLLKDMEKYIEYVANSLLHSMDYPPLFEDCEQCPFPFMIQLNLQGKTNFFESNVSDYQNPNVMYSNDLDFSQI